MNKKLRYKKYRTPEIKVSIIYLESGVLAGSTNFRPLDSAEEVKLIDWDSGSDIDQNYDQW